ncbi:hypothetical protein AAFF_G00420690 [Aldrovandia affinis]|uniref:Uncharacterized protein n=1 Tax=Aldrovandia affinis TaxID=143900 RepID=A0AAD7SBY2_9TELE|nr:hypothetical protein AAFF_G00420690 [Aldrovandia affinis]
MPPNVASEDVLQKTTPFLRHGAKGRASRGQQAQRTRPFKGHNEKKSGLTDWRNSTASSSDRQFALSPTVWLHLDEFKRCSTVLRRYTANGKGRRSSLLFGIPAHCLSAAFSHHVVELFGCQAAPYGFSTRQWARPRLPAQGGQTCLAVSLSAGRGVELCPGGHWRLLIRSLGPGPDPGEQALHPPRLSTGEQ